VNNRPNILFFLPDACYGQTFVTLSAITFIWPDDKDLQKVIVDWIQQYGLR